jgi:hypothetical protein
MAPRPPGQHRDGGDRFHPEDRTILPPGLRKAMRPFWAGPEGAPPPLAGAGSKGTAWSARVHSLDVKYWTITLEGRRDGAWERPLVPL